MASLDESTLLAPHQLKHASGYERHRDEVERHARSGLVAVELGRDQDWAAFAASGDANTSVLALEGYARGVLARLATLPSADAGAAQAEALLDAETARLDDALADLQAEAALAREALARAMGAARAETEAGGSALPAELVALRDGARLDAIGGAALATDGRKMSELTGTSEHSAFRRAHALLEGGDLDGALLEFLRGRAAEGAGSTFAQRLEGKLRQMLLRRFDRLPAAAAATSGKRSRLAPNAPSRDGTLALMAALSPVKDLCEDACKWRQQKLAEAVPAVLEPAPVTVGVIENLAMVVENMLCDDLPLLEALVTADGAPPLSDLMQELYLKAVAVAFDRCANHLKQQAATEDYAEAMLSQRETVPMTMNRTYEVIASLLASASSILGCHAKLAAATRAEVLELNRSGLLLDPRRLLLPHMSWLGQAISDHLDHTCSSLLAMEMTAYQRSQELPAEPPQYDVPGRWSFPARSRPHLVTLAALRWADNASTLVLNDVSSATKALRMDVAAALVRCVSKMTSQWLQLPGGTAAVQPPILALQVALNSASWLRGMLSAVTQHFAGAWAVDASRDYDGGTESTMSDLEAACSVAEGAVTQLADMTTSLQVHAARTTILPSIDSANWTAHRPFLEESARRPSYGLQMWNMYLQGAWHDAAARLSPASATETMARLLLESTASVMARYSALVFSRARAPQLQRDLCTLVSIARSFAVVLQLPGKGRGAGAAQVATKRVNDMCLSAVKMLALLCAPMPDLIHFMDDWERRDSPPTDEHARPPPELWSTAPPAEIAAAVADVVNIVSLAGAEESVELTTPSDIGMSMGFDPSAAMGTLGPLRGAMWDLTLAPWAEFPFKWGDLLRLPVAETALSRSSMLDLLRRRPELRSGDFPPLAAEATVRKDEAKMKLRMPRGHMQPPRKILAEIEEEEAAIAEVEAQDAVQDATQSRRLGELNAQRELILGTIEELEAIIAEADKEQAQAEAVVEHFETLLRSLEMMVWPQDAELHSDGLLERDEGRRRTSRRS